jgi:DNA polymerase-2
MKAAMEFSGWLLDVYEDRSDGIVLWFITEGGERVRLRQRFPVTFYAAGPAPQLRKLWRWLREQDPSLKLWRTERRDLFLPQPVNVLAAEVENAVNQPRLFQGAAQAFPDLTYYDADIPLGLRHAAVFDTFPLQRCHVLADGRGVIQELRSLESPWDLDPEPAPLRVLKIEPDVDPSHTPPRLLEVEIEHYHYSLPLEPARALLVNLKALLQQHDPDLLFTGWGDTWLLPLLLELSRKCRIALPLNRDRDHGVARKAELTYFSYGQIIFRGGQVHLFGRWHIDRCNAMMWGDYGLDGVLEVGRVTALPLQTAARVSPGTGISSMQILTALRTGVLVPWHKQQAERGKTALELLHADMGGLVYQPLMGLHYNVGAIDFVSMYPSIMVRCNISPETIPNTLADPLPSNPGLVPQTLAPLLKKRIELKRLNGSRPAWDPRAAREKARAQAHKWLLVTCFGYLGYKNARFGRIEAHEAVTANGREALMLAKEAAEDAGFTILHMYVDGLWVQKPGAAKPEDFQPLLDDIADRTGLSIGLDGVYRWVAFLPARRDLRMPVANRYFGAFQDGSLKVRGIEARRRDAPTFIVDTQMELIRCMVDLENDDQIPARLQKALALLSRRLNELRTGKVALDRLLVAQRLSKEVDRYKTPSPGARAVIQLQGSGKSLRPGQRARFLYIRGGTGVHAWDLPRRPLPAEVDVARYRILLLRAASAVLQPFGICEAELDAWMNGGAIQPSLLRKHDLKTSLRYHLPEVD